MTLKSPPGYALPRGRRGDRHVLQTLCEWRDAGKGDLVRPDFLWLPKLWAPFLIEAKDQDVFEPPPFFGHGLGKRQRDVYMDVWRRVRLATLLWVVDERAGVEHMGFLHLLERGPLYETTGPEPRIIYPLTSFMELA